MGPKELSQLIEKEVSQEEKLTSSEVSIFLCRYDGVVLYSSSPAQKYGRDESSIGALIGGVWQAADSLANFLGSHGDREFRFSFDTTDTGVYVLKINVGKETYYLGTLFNAELNPGLLKSKVRSLVARVEKVIEEAGSNENLENKNEMLFEDITDDEIDDMFSTVGI